MEQRIPADQRFVQMWSNVCVGVQVCDKVQGLGIWDVEGTGSRTTINVAGHRTIEEAACTLMWTMYYTLPGRCFKSKRWYRRCMGCNCRSGKDRSCTGCSGCEEQHGVKNSDFLMKKQLSERSLMLWREWESIIHSTQHFQPIWQSWKKERNFCTDLLQGN